MDRPAENPCDPVIPAPVLSLSKEPLPSVMHTPASVMRMLALVIPVKTGIQPSAPTAGIYQSSIAPNCSVRAITNALNVVDKPRLCYNSIGFISCMLFRPLGS